MAKLFDKYFLGVFAQNRFSFMFYLIDKNFFIFKSVLFQNW